MLKPGGVLIGATPDPLFFGGPRGHALLGASAVVLDRSPARRSVSRSTSASSKPPTISSSPPCATTSARSLPPGRCASTGSASGPTLGVTVRSRRRARRAFGCARASSRRRKPDAPAAHWSGEGDGLVVSLVAGREPRRITLRLEACVERAGELTVQLGDQEIGRAQLGEAPRRGDARRAYRSRPAATASASARARRSWCAGSRSPPSR